MRGFPIRIATVVEESREKSNKQNLQHAIIISTIMIHYNNQIEQIILQPIQVVSYPFFYSWLRVRLLPELESFVSRDFFWYKTSKSGP